MKISHDAAKNRFLAKIDDHEAYVEYIQTDRTLEVTHTEVPTQLAGRGLGSKLVAAAFEYAQSSNLDFTPTCPYALSWLAKNHFSKSPKAL